MYLIKTYIDKSPIDGMGAFAGEKIKKGQVVWRFEPELDRFITKAQFYKYPKVIQDHIRKCGVIPEGSTDYILGIDNDSFVNHSDEPNLIGDSSKSYEVSIPLVACRDVAIGEELTQNYYEYNSKDHVEYLLSHFKSK